MVSEWSEEDVLAWLREEGLEAVIDVFQSNNIDGEELLSLTKETLSSELHIGKITAHITLDLYSSLTPCWRLWMYSTFKLCVSLYVNITKECVYVCTYLYPPISIYSGLYI